jgi:transaldolase
MRIAIAADHAGLPLRAVVADAVTGAAHEPVLMGPDSGEPVDYPDIAAIVAEAIVTGNARRGVIVCGSGAGVTVAANKLRLIRAALAHDTYTAHQMVEHDDVNVLTLGARVIGPALAAEVVTAFCGATFSGVERHARRLSKVLRFERERTMNAPQQLRAAGQSLWLDNIRKSLLTSGTLARYIDDLAVSGLTSNPTILQKAISAGPDYDEAIRRHVAAGITDAEPLAFALALDDLVAAADLVRPIYDATRGVDGYVSLEVSPTMAYDAEATVAAGRRLFEEADRPNFLIKVPGTREGFVAIEELIAAGVPVNVTLLFSPAQYLEAAESYLRGIERRKAAGLPLAVASVASVFVSRWDSAADPKLPPELHGKLGIASVQKTYAAYRRLLSSDRWHRLAALGAMPQRPLWASTSTKDPSLPDTYYLGRLAAPGTVDTVPEPTLLAFAEHGVVCDLLQPDEAGADEVITAVTKAGVDVDALAADLQAKGAALFAESWQQLLEGIAAKAGQLSAPVSR